jgi:hypothetical protein
MLELLLMADATDYTSPITMTYTVIEKAVGKEPKKPPSVLSKEKQAKFDKMAKEDWIKDDPHADMWDTNWISSIQPDKKDNDMSYDILKQALEKKKQAQGQSISKKSSGTVKSHGKNQVTSHKPAKKSAGRGR